MPLLPGLPSRQAQSEEVDDCLLEDGAEQSHPSPPLLAGIMSRTAVAAERSPSPLQPGGLSLAGVASRTADVDDAAQDVEHRHVNFGGRQSAFVDDETGDIIDPVNCWKGVSRHDFKAIQILGVGGFGEVKLVRFLRNKQVYAMKSIAKADIHERTLTGDRSAAAMLMAERNFGVQATQWNCPFLIRMYATFQTSEKLYYIYEFAAGGELFSLVRAQPNGHLEEVTAKFYSAELTLALEYLHDRSVIHRDVKLENVLLCKDGHTKLADFGCVRAELPEAGTDSYIACTDPRIFMPPEFRRGERYGKELDCWQLGVAIFAMLAGYYPERVTTEALVFPPHFTECAQELCAQLLSLVREERLGFPDGARTVVHHNFFARLEWEAIRLKDLAPPFTLDEGDDPENHEFSLLRPRCGTAFAPAGAGATDVLRIRGFSFAQEETTTNRGLDTPAAGLATMHEVGDQVDSPKLQGRPEDCFEPKETSPCP